MVDGPLLNAMHPKLFIVVVALVAWCTSATADEYRFTTEARVVAIADVHGVPDRLRALLHETGLIDGDDRWSGGDTHLVFTGDLVDRGDDGRGLYDLVMRLEDEAAAAGGRVHLLLANHEVMNLTGDLRYVSEGDYALFGGPEARRQAFAPDGRYGRWLFDKPLMIVVNDTLFVHGGLPPMLLDYTLESLNEVSHEQIHAAALEWMATGEFPRPSGPPFDRDGPLWYRGSSRCDWESVGDLTTQILARYGAERVVVGHTVTENRRVTSRLQGRVIRLDTGMNAAFYEGRASAVVFEDGDIYAVYTGEGRREVEAETDSGMNCE
jgi:hypothetical protein